MASKPHRNCPTHFWLRLTTYKYCKSDAITIKKNYLKLFKKQYKNNEYYN